MVQFICPDCGMDISATQTSEDRYYLGAVIFTLQHYYCARDKARYTPYANSNEYLKEWPIIDWPINYAVLRSAT